MRSQSVLLLVVILAGVSLSAQSQAPADLSAVLAFAEKAGVRAVNFEMGDLASLKRFTSAAPTARSTQLTKRLFVIL